MRKLNWVVAAAFAIAVAACNQPGAGAGAGASTPSAEVAGEMTLGQASAAVTLVEYAAPTCPYCKQFHDQIIEPIKAKYIDTGKVKFVLREFPSHNPPVDIAVFQIARCAGADKYFDVIDGAFAAQETLERATATGGAKPELIKLAQAHGLSAEKAEACIADPAGVKRIQDGVAKAQNDFDITGTPTIMLNGTVIRGQTEPDAYTLAGLSARIDQALADAAPK